MQSARRSPCPRSAPASPHVQRKLTHALEQDQFNRAVADAQPDVTMRAFLNSCNGRWIRVARLPFLQLSNSETITRMQRYLRLPISTLFGVVGRKSLGKFRALRPHKWRVMIGRKKSSRRRPRGGLAKCDLRIS